MNNWWKSYVVSTGCKCIIQNVGDNRVGTNNKCFLMDVKCFEIHQCNARGHIPVNTVQMLFPIAVTICVVYNRGDNGRIK